MRDEREEMKEAIHGMQCFDISLKLLLSILILLPKDCLSRSGKENRVQQLDTSWIQISVLTIFHANLT